MKKTILQQVMIGVKLGLSTSNLPDNVLKFHSNPIVKVLRFICGFSGISLMCGRFIELPIIFTIFAVFFTIIHFIYIIYININKFIHMRKILKSDKFDI